MPSKKQIAANKKNAMQSTGPRTPEGKRASSKNARKHLVFANDVVAEGEDRTLFTQLLDQLVEELSPETQIEMSIVERIAITGWRERRLAVAERNQLNEVSRNQIYVIDPIIDDLNAPPAAPSLSFSDQYLIGRYQVMLTNQARKLLKELRAEQDRRMNTIEGGST